MSFTRGAKQRGGFPKPEDLPHDDRGRHTRDGWQHEKDHDSIQLGGRQYRNMKEWSRPCAICGAKYSVFEKAGSVDANSRFGNKTCDEHRGLLPAFEKGYIAWDAQRSVMTAGLRCAGDGAASIELQARLKETEEGAIEASIQAGGVRKAISEQLGLSLIGDGITYDTVTAAIRELKGTHELPAAMRDAALHGVGMSRTYAEGGEVKTVSEKMPWE